jgi:hypothetical protein
VQERAKRIKSYNSNSLLAGDAKVPVVSFDRDLDKFKDITRWSR